MRLILRDEAQKVGSARRVTLLTWSLFFDGKVILLAVPTLTFVWLAQPGQLRLGEAIGGCVSFWFGQRGQRFSHVNAR